MLAQRHHTPCHPSPITTTVLLFFLDSFCVYDAAIEYSFSYQLAKKMDDAKAHIAVIGAGWWSQGWHLPQLFRNNERVKIVAIVDTCSEPKSSLNPTGMESLAQLSKRYNCPFYSSVEDMLRVVQGGENSLDGVIVGTNHSSHYEIAAKLDQWSKEKKHQQQNQPLCILMEKPMTTSVQQAIALHQLVTSTGNNDNAGNPGNLRLLMNHSANYRSQARLAHDAVQKRRIGRIRHISASMECPLQFLFDNPANTGWVLPDEKVTIKNNKIGEKMLGNGFGWGQSCHLLGWIYHVCDATKLIPLKVYCCMNHSETTGADTSFSATVHCQDNIHMSISGTALVPGFEHSDPPVSKCIRIHVYGTDGAILYSGKDRDVESGKLELMTTTTMDDTTTTGHQNTQTEHVILSPKFQFENCESEGTGPESLQNFISMCLQEEFYAGADTLVGLRTVQTVEAMYRSNMLGEVVDVIH